MEYTKQQIIKSLRACAGKGICNNCVLFEQRNESSPDCVRKLLLSAADMLESSEVLNRAKKFMKITRMWFEE